MYNNDGVSLTATHYSLQTTSNGPYQGPKVLYFVPRTTDYLPALCPDSDYWTHAPGVCNVTTKSWLIIHRWLFGDTFETILEGYIIDFLREVGLCYLMWRAKYRVRFLICTTWRHSETRLTPQISNTIRLCNPAIEHKQLVTIPTCEGRLIYL